MQSKAPTVAAYLAELPPDRRQIIATIRGVVRRHPLCFAAIASQKNHCAVHLMHAYEGSTPAKVLAAGFKNAGKKLDMGKCCVRFRTLDDLPLGVIATVIAGTPPQAFIAQYEAGQKLRRTIT